MSRYSYGHDDEVTPALKLNSSKPLAFERDVVSELGIPGVTPGPPEAWGIPSIGISGYNGFGDSTQGPYTNRNKVFEFTDNVSWLRGGHSFKLGASATDQFDQVGNQFSRGSFAFDGRATGSATAAATPGGAAFADFLLGYMRTPESAVALATTQYRPRTGHRQHRHVAHAELQLR